jgi:Protein of unknown function (DUF3530)
MRLLSCLVALLLSLGAAASDYGRENNWAEEILPAVLVGDPVWLEQSNGHKFLGLYTEAANAKAAAVMVHGSGVHPDWGLIGMLRQQLPEAGYTTLSIQMPVLRPDAKAEEYGPTFPEAAERILHAVAYLKAKGYRKIAIVSHSLGCPMSYAFLAGGEGKEVAAWVAIGAAGEEDWSLLTLPILDLYGQNDLPRVLKNAPRRGAQLRNKGSRQLQEPGADHFWEGRDAALLGDVRTFLDQTL